MVVFSLVAVSLVVAGLPPPKGPSLLIHITSASGSGLTELAAFDAALHRAGIADHNLLVLSSVIPVGAELVLHEGPVPRGAVRSRWGDRLFVVMAERRVSAPGGRAVAGIGWVQDAASGRGLFVEHTGESEEAVAAAIRTSLAGLTATRGTDLGPVAVRLATETCADRPVCALSVAVFAAEPWRREGRFRLPRPRRRPAAPA